MTQHSIAIPKFNTLGEDIFKFFESTTTPGSLKDIYTKKLSIINKPLSELFGASSPTTVTGLTVRDLILNPHGYNSENNEQYVQNLEAIDDLVYEQGKSITSSNGSFVDGNGIVRIGKVVKSPIFNHKKKVVAIMSYADDITHYYDPLTLFNLYQLHYIGAQGVPYLLQYLNENQSFFALSTQEEIGTLLTLYASTLHQQGIKNLTGNTTEKIDAAYPLSSQLKYGSLEEIIELFLKTVKKNKLPIQLN